LKETYGLRSVPQVLVLDKNLELITRQGADDLLHFSAVQCRNLWCEMLQKIINDQDDEEDDTREMPTSS
jgi:hypothetical protein